MEAGGKSGHKVSRSFWILFLLSQIHFLYYGKLLCLNCVFFSLKNGDVGAYSIYLPPLSVTGHFIKGMVDRYMIGAIQMLY